MMSFPISFEPVKLILSTAGWVRSGRAGAGADPRDDVEHAGRQAGLLADPGQLERGERCLLGRLEDDGAAGGEGRRDLLAWP